MFKIGDRVISEKFGLGTIAAIYSTKMYRLPILVKFNNSEIMQSFNLDGYFEECAFDIRNIKLFSEEDDVKYY